MGKVVVSVKIMPKSPDVDLEKVEAKVKEVLKEKKGTVHKVDKTPIAFGLVALNVSYIITEEEAEGGTDPIDEAIKEIEGVNDAETTDVTKMVDVSFG